MTFEDPKLSRFFRLYEKKRGKRRTGSQTVGSLGEAMFFGVFFIVGCAAMAYMLIVLVWPEWRANRQFDETKGIILEKRLGRSVSSDPGGLQATQYRPEFKVRYETPEGTYEADNVYDATNLYSTDEANVREVIEAYQLGAEYPMWYDPLDPGRVVLVRGYSQWLYISLLIPLSFIVIGGGRMVYALVHWNTSEELRSVIDQRAAKRDLFEGPASEDAFPTVPKDSNLTNSPGTTLAYRLPMSTTPGWRLFATAAACIAWNGIVALFVIIAIGRFTSGERDWLLAGALIPFLIGGIGLCVYLGRQIALATSVGPTRVEISTHPLTPGSRCEAFLSQAGRLKMKSLEVWLACDERTTFRQGTDTRTESRRVYQLRSFIRSDFEIAQGLPFESRLVVSVPATAMHSFHAAHNELSWKLIVKGDVAGRPPFEREFQIVVSPARKAEAEP
jgi:hypothetical protein